MPFNILNAPLQILQDELLVQKNISLSVLRLDEIHSMVSGNKIFKLHYFLQQALSSAHKTVLTFGGAYSNHLIATAFASKAYGLRSIGIVRGERPPTLSHTLQQCIDCGMELHFISRLDYNKKEEPSFIENLKSNYGKFVLIPEGGYHPVGANGAALIVDLLKENNYTHMATATGTATTLAGLVMNSQLHQKIIAVPVLKNMRDIDTRINFLCHEKFLENRIEIFDEYHFGGYAKKNSNLINFMNTLWLSYKLPTDFVYTAKLFFAIFDKIKTNYFEPQSKILCLHTGGLQGNSSLPKGTLLF